MLLEDKRTTEDFSLLTPPTAAQVSPAPAEQTQTDIEAALQQASAFHSTWNLNLINAGGPGTWTRYLDQSPAGRRGQWGAIGRSDWPMRRLDSLNHL